MKEKMLTALEEIISNLEDELNHLKNDRILYDNPAELLEYVKENFFTQFEEDLKQ